MTIYIESVRAKVVCDCGAEKILYSDNNVRIDELQDILEFEAEELGWVNAECPECWSRTVKESDLYHS
jgi:hypothetical protein